MPELPEVETVRRQLSERIPGRRITALRVMDALLVAPATPEELAAAVVGAEVRVVDRRGKYLLIRLDDGAALAVHLRMTGRFHWHPQPPVDTTVRFLRAVFTLDDGAAMTFADQRRFGRMWIIPAAVDEERYWRGRVGVEPLGPRFTPTVLGALLAGRRVGVKAALLNQALVAGVGNIYADEALFGAGIHPERPAGELDTAELERLHATVREALQAGIASGGASINSYADGLGNRGTMQQNLRVHLHEGEPCVRCGGTVVKSRVAQRGTYWCPDCQPAAP